MTMKSCTEKDYRERLYAVLTHIQGRLDKALSLEKLAEVASFSPFHFHRIFKGMVGESVKQYVKRLRLERAAVQLKLTDRPVLQIAFNAGYETHEAFTRAFKTRFHRAPSNYREDYRPHDDEAASLVAGGSEPRIQLQLDEGDPMDVTIKRIEPLRVVFIRHVGPYADVGAAYTRLVAWAMPRGLLGPQTQIVGVSYDDPEVTAAEKLRCDACLVAGNHVQGEGEVGVQTIGGGAFATTIHRGPYEYLNDVYERLLGRWFPRSGREPASAPCLEFYRNNPQFTAAEDLLTEVCVPLHEQH